VPNRAQECHCGFVRDPSPSRERSDRRDQPVSTIQPARRRVVFVAGAILVCVCGLALWTVTRRQKQIRFSEGVEDQLRRETIDDTQLPVVDTESGPREVEPGPTDERDENHLASAPPGEQVTEPPRPSPSPSAYAVTPGMPTMTPENDERLRTIALLEARLIPIAKELSSLEVAYRVFAQACQSQRLDDETENNWLVGLKRGPEKSAVSGIPLTNRGASFDCAGSWKDLTNRVSGLKAELDQIAEQARQNRVLPGDWRKLLASHRLNHLQEY
jgi:hypothetical protein